jgi:nitrite reductase/ring-hydroxylating ferredoxin subunit
MAKMIKRSFVQRVLGNPKTNEPEAADCWTYKDGQLRIQLQKTPELKTLGGALRFEGKALPLRVLVVHSEDGQYRAYQNKCTHFGRRLDPVPGTNTVQCCSVNHSTFDCCGEKMNGPARGPVKTFSVEMNQEGLIIFIAE